MGDFFGGGMEDSVQTQRGTQTTSTGPPEWMNPYLRGAFKRADRLYEDQPLYRGAPFRGDEIAGMGRIQHVARNPLLTAPALGYAGDVIGGEYLGADALRQAAEPYIGQALQGVRSGFEGAGGRGGSMEAIATGEGVARALAPVYERERDRQQAMALAAPGLEASRYAPGQALLGIGGMQEQRIQQRYREPWERYGMSLAPFGGNPAAFAGGETEAETFGQTVSPVYGPSPFSQFLGAGLAGAGLAGNLGWRPFGGGIG